MRKTKIICTVGPASESDEMLRNLILQGMNVARLNFSHGTHMEHLEKINKIKKISRELEKFVAILLDTKGPEIRTGKFGKPEVTLIAGQKFQLTSKDVVGDENRCTVTYKGLAEDLAAGNKILIDDGLIQLKVNEIQGTEIICTVENSGIVKDNKGINVPGVKIKLPALTEKDKEDILFGINNGVDYIAVSFVRTAEDVKAIREYLMDNGGKHIHIIAKIENKEGLDNIDEIIEVSDGIMVARGDLGVEIPEEEVPIAQKSIIRKCNNKGVIAVTATQMLDSMMRNPRATRAEVADVANAIFDGTDAIMLSGETASGKYPLESIMTMNNIAVTTEKALDYKSIHARLEEIKDESITSAVGHATCMAAEALKAKAILTPTTSGKTAFVVSRFRPEVLIIAPTYKAYVARRLALCWGTMPVMIDEADHQRDVYDRAINVPKSQGLISDGDCIIITAGVPLLAVGNTNMMRIHIVGDKL